MEALKAVGVCRSYGRTPVLSGFDLTVASGSFEALMGPSGCGKSTFLHLAAGLLAVDTGTIEIGGTPVTALGDAAAARFRRRHVGVVFQQFNLLAEKTVRENVLLPLALESPRLARSAEATQRVDALLTRLGLADQAYRRSEELSGGEQQRVAIARALAAEPDVVLADEPTGNLDVSAAKEVCALLKSVNAASRSAILVVTHDPMVAAAASRVHFLRGGRIVSSCPTEGDAGRVSRAYLETYR